MAQYLYDGQGALVKRIMAGGTWTVYIGGIYEKRSNGTYVKYYFAFGRRIAMRDNTGVVHYILADHLGSSTTITDASGGDLRTMKYYPYGAQRSASGDMITDKLFTGQQREPEAVSTLGLYNYGARFYSTLTGRFVSPDPVAQAPLDPQMLNRYSYVRNNPLIFVDPSGLQAMPPIVVEGIIAWAEPDPPPRLPGFTEEEWEKCLADLSGCFAGKYGPTDYGLIIVMGMFQSEGDIDDFWGYAKYFLGSEYGPAGCQGQAGTCWEAAKLLMHEAGADAVYDVFGIRFIASDPGGLGAGWLFSDKGEGTLRHTIENPGGKEIIGVIGYSIGAQTVAKVFWENRDKPRYQKIPFFLDEPAQLTSFNIYEAMSLPNFAGMFGFWSCKDCGGYVGIGPLQRDIPHGVHNRNANYVFFCMARVRAGVGGCGTP